MTRSRVRVRLSRVSRAEDPIAALFGVPLDAFVTERAALAKRLAAAGEAAAAARVKALAKPPVAVWAVNQLARSAPAEIEALIEAGDALRSAQLSGASGDAVRAATQAQRTALRVLGEQLAEVLTSAGHAASAATVERARTLLRTASLDADAQPDLRRGTLVEDLEDRGFEALAGAVRGPAPTRAVPERPTPGPRAAVLSLSSARERATAAREAERAEQADKAARAAEKERRAREAEEARQAQLRERLAELEDAAEARATEAREAARQHREANSAVIAAQGAVTEAQRALATAEQAAAQAERAAAHATARAEAAHEKVRDQKEKLRSG